MSEFLQLVTRRFISLAVVAFTATSFRVLRARAMFSSVAPAMQCEFSRGLCPCSDRSSEALSNIGYIELVRDTCGARTNIHFFARTIWTWNVSRSIFRAICFLSLLYIDSRLNIKNKSMYIDISWWRDGLCTNINPTEVSPSIQEDWFREGM